MSYFAEIDENNIVKRVIAISQENVNTGTWGSPDNWIQTSYNTHGGVHYAPNSHTPDGGVALRKNYAGKGYTYDQTRDAFYTPQPYPSWTLDDDTCRWNPPTAYPDDGKNYNWDEDETKWAEATN
tara:strand:+ start:18 stop:392 length:375 start_codon:yes stop_codon:yes gene_type:complete